jgi:hypothetical protein
MVWGLGMNFGDEGRLLELPGWAAGLRRRARDFGLARGAGVENTTQAAINVDVFFEK